MAVISVMEINSIPFMKLENLLQIHKSKIMADWVILDFQRAFFIANII